MFYTWLYLSVWQSIHALSLSLSLSLSFSLSLSNSVSGLQYNVAYSVWTLPVIQVSTSTWPLLRPALTHRKM